jgi:hypothetical protein
MKTIDYTNNLCYYDLPNLSLTLRTHVSHNNLMLSLISVTTTFGIFSFRFEFNQHYST